MARTPYDHGVRTARRAAWFAVLGAGCAFNPPSGSPPVDAGASDAAAEDAAAVDATVEPPPDAPAALCPSSYAAAGALSSHYRITETATAFRAGHDDCKDDLLGSTHLVVLDAPGELAALRAQFADREWWIGAVQAPTLIVPWGNWSNIVGGAAAVPWRFGQPDDDGGVFGFEASVANVAASVVGGVVDRRPGTLQFAVCECDGRAVDPGVEGVIPD